MSSSQTSTEPEPVKPHASSPLPHNLNPPAFPTGSAPIRFMKAAIAANVPLIAVTGGLSYTGSHIVAEILRKGHFVRTIVPQAANCDFLKRLPGATTRLQLVPVRDPAAEDARSTILIAFRGVSTVVHAASFAHAAHLAPPLTARRIVAALKMSLDAACMPGNVITNFVYLSSELAVFDPKLHSRRSTPVLSANDWYDCTRSARQTSHPFAYANTVAEMRLWARVAAGHVPFNVCSVIPSFLLGPVLSARQVPSSPTLSFFTALANGSLQQVPDFPMAPVDVRDVARAVTTLTGHPEISGRILLSADSLTSSEFLAKAAVDFPSFRWPKPVQKHFFRRATVRGGVEALKALKLADFAASERHGRKYAFSQKRARDELRLVFRPVHVTIQETLSSLQRFRVLPFHSKRRPVRQSDVAAHRPGSRRPHSFREPPVQEKFSTTRAARMSHIPRTAYDRLS